MGAENEIIHIASSNLRTLLAQKKQEGRREVVEWIQKEGIWSQVPFEGKRKEETMWCLFPEEWQAQLKLWFKDNPKLLKEWGVTNE